MTIPPGADKPRLVIDYGGLQIHESRYAVRLLLIGKPPLGLTARLREDGFTRRADGTWDRPNNPHSIFAAQAIGRTFFKEGKDA